MSPTMLHESRTFVPSPSPVAEAPSHLKCGTQTPEQQALNLKRYIEVPELLGVSFFLVVSASDAVYQSHKGGRNMSPIAAAFARNSSSTAWVAAWANECINEIKKLPAETSQEWTSAT